MTDFVADPNEVTVTMEALFDIRTDVRAILAMPKEDDGEEEEDTTP